MHLELSVALNFIISYLYNKLPRRRVDMFCEELEKGLEKKFQGHWYPEEPFKGSGFRSIKLSSDKVDPVFDTAAQLSGLCVSEIHEYLPKGLTLWIDPNEVSYRIGENGMVKILYCNHKNGLKDFNLEKSMDPHARPLSQGFNPTAESFLPNDRHLPTSLSGLNILPSSAGGSNGSTSPSSGTSNSTSPVGSFRPRQSASTCFTAAAFAQTKFGSTKMKSQAQRPTRLSPTELGGVFPPVGAKHSPISPLWPSLNPCLSSPTSNVNLLQLSPMQSFPQFIGVRDSRFELLKEQQQCLLLLQQQQQKMKLHDSIPESSVMSSPLGPVPLSSSTWADDALKSLTIPGAFHDQHSQLQQQQQQQQLFLRPLPSSTSHKSVTQSACASSLTSAVSDSLLLGPQQQQQQQQRSAPDIFIRSRSDAHGLDNQNLLRDSGNISQVSTPEDLDWSALINPCANNGHLLVAN